jgi:HAD superfamily hydrolase (TIGR01509 family)
VTATPSRLQGIVFDFDGLILDTEMVGYESINEIFRAHDTELSLELWQSFIGTTDHPHWTEILADQIDGPVDGDALQGDRHAEYHRRLDELDPQPGVIELLDAAGTAGVALAVASSSPADWVRPHLERLGIVDCFTSIHTGDQVAHSKPHPELFLRAADSVGGDTASIVAIEDSVIGCTAATAAGLTTVAVPSAITRGMNFSHADLVVESLADVSLGSLNELLVTDR